MVFSSLIFLYEFLPLSRAVYALCRSLRAKNISLLVFSLIFYAWGEQVYVLLLMAMALFDWYFALRVQRAQREEKNAKLWVALACVVNLGLIGFFKYAGMVCSIFGDVPAFVQRIALPLGISFYTFQSMGYIIDIYREKFPAERNFGKMLLFTSFFPQIVQGPISFYSDLSGKLYEGHDISFSNIKQGVLLITWGFFKKLVIADRLVNTVLTIPAEYEKHSGTVILITALFYAVQLYADFSGGIDISRGVSQLFGIDLAENFRRPYFSRNISEYWHRWHITLGAWLREYLFYPIAMSKLFQKFGRSLKKHFGMKISKVLPVSIASLITFIVVGIWHGAYWRYVGFGLWNGLIIMVSTLLEDKYAVWKKTLHIRDTNKLFILFQMFRTFLIVLVGYYFDIAPGFTAALKMMWLSITDFHISELADPAIFDALGVSSASLILVAIAVLALLVCSIVQECSGRTLREMICSKGFWAEAGVFLLLFWVVAIFGVYGPGTNPAEFVYMQF